MHKALEISHPANLSGFSRLLHSHGIEHRIVEERGHQVLWVNEAGQIEQATALYRRFLADPSLQHRAAPAVVANDSEWWLAWLRAPVTLTLVALTVGVTGVLWLTDSTTLLGWLTFYDLTQIGPYAILNPAVASQPWRLLTPIFLHFGLLHLVFNMLWLAELGRRIEWAQGGKVLLLLVVVLGLISNCAQAWVARESLFGGMSGVIFGLFGYCWLWERFRKTRLFALPRGVIGFLLIWLALGYSNILTIAGFGSIANTAHASGLLAGLLVAAIALIATASPPRQRREKE